MVPAAAKRLGVPVIFWSEPEPPWDGGRIQKNSFCGTNCNAHALWKMRLPYTFVYGEDESAVDEIGRKLRELFRETEQDACDGVPENDRDVLLRCLSQIQKNFRS